LPMTAAAVSSVRCIGFCCFIRTPAAIRNNRDLSFASARMPSSVARKIQRRRCRVLLRSMGKRRHPARQRLGKLMDRNRSNLIQCCRPTRSATIDSPRARMGDRKSSEFGFGSDCCRHVTRASVSDAHQTRTHSPPMEAHVALTEAHAASNRPSKSESSRNMRHTPFDSMSSPPR